MRGSRGAAGFDQAARPGLSPSSIPSITSIQEARNHRARATVNAAHRRAVAIALNLSMWIKNGNTSASYGIIVYCETSLGAGNTQMQYWFHSNTNTVDTPNKKGYIFLGNAWYTATNWQHFERNVAADVAALWPGQSLTKIHGLLLTGSDLYVDDMTIDMAGWSKARHGGAEWTRGADSFPSSWVAKDVAVYY